MSVGDTRLTPLELKTCLMEVSNLCNERPLGGLMPREDGTFEVITPNQLLMGWSGESLPDSSSLVEKLPMRSRFRAVSHVASSFWNRWKLLVSPSLVCRQKWHTNSRNVKEGDLVLIADSGPIKGQYQLGVIFAVHTSGDDLVRSATVQYFKRGNSGGWTTQQVVRSVQRLVMILPVEEQMTRLQVKEDQVCKAS